MSATQAAVLSNDSEGRPVCSECGLLMRARAEDNDLYTWISYMLAIVHDHSLTHEIFDGVKPVWADPSPAGDQKQDHPA